MTRATWAEHLAECKADALRVLVSGAGAKEAVTTMGADIGRYQGDDAPAGDLVAMLVLTALLGPQDDATIRRWIEEWH